MNSPVKQIIKQYKSYKMTLFQTPSAPLMKRRVIILLFLLAIMMEKTQITEKYR